MITFKGGPAEGQSLCLKRAPILLRVVRDSTGNWDALDRLDDMPRLDERIYAYVRDGTPGWVHIDGTRGGRRYGETLLSASYYFCEKQPSDEVARNTASWREWCERYPRVLEEPEEVLP